jgi:hypothetical protein
MGPVGFRKTRILAAILFASLLAGCYDAGGWGGGPGYYSNGGYGSNGGASYYTNNVYRGYGGYSEPGLFGGYPPAHEAWDASARGRSSYGDGYHGGGGEEHGDGHGANAQRDGAHGGGGGHSGGSGGSHGH